MEKQRSQNRLSYPYLILAIALVCTALILFDLWSTVDDQVPFPWEGPSPTPTLWWRTPEAATPAPPSSALKPAYTASITQGTPVPVADTFLEFIDG